MRHRPVRGDVRIVTVVDSHTLIAFQVRVAVALKRPVLLVHLGHVRQAVGEYLRRIRISGHADRQRGRHRQSSRQKYGCQSLDFHVAVLLV